MSRYASTSLLCRRLSLKETLRCALAVAVLHSLFIYTAYASVNAPLLTTVSGVVSLAILLNASVRVWVFSGFFIGVLWFWWIALSFIHYRILWAVPLGMIFVGLTYAALFGTVAFIAEKSAGMIRFFPATTRGTLLATLFKALGLWLFSYVHPFGFDWYKPELMFVESYFGVTKTAFALILAALALAIATRKPVWLLLLFFAVDTQRLQIFYDDTKDTALVTTYTPVEQKWDPRYREVRFTRLLQAVTDARTQGKRLVILPESVFNVYVMRDATLLARIHKAAEGLTLVTGGLYWDGQNPKNVAYVFHPDGNVTVGEKTVLVPFGEANPLPTFLSDWVNRVFYDGAVDYVAADRPTDVTVAGKRYRLAVCFEATSERLYDPPPKRMIVLSNNGWFTPSTEPTLQRLLLQYYARKYGTAYLHAVNMSPSYSIRFPRRKANKTR